MGFYIPELKGVLIKVDEDEKSRFAYEIWFPYTKDNVRVMREGAFVAVRNFASDGSDEHFSILEITSVLPRHYALGTDTSGYPGYLVEAAKNITADWEQLEPTEDSTQIVCAAIPTNFEFVPDQKGGTAFNLQEEENVAMLGEEVKVFSTEYVERIVNYGIRDGEVTIIAGELIRDEDVRVQMRMEEFLKVHFGVFGFTGAGKSNLLSTYIARLLETGQGSGHHIKIVLFDLMSEYTVLLLDKLLGHEITGGLVMLGRHTLPEPVFKFANLPTGHDESPHELKQAAEAFRRYALPPKALKGDPYDLQITRGLAHILKRKLLRVFIDAQNMSVYDLFFTNATPWGKDRRGPNLNKRRELSKRALASAKIGSSYKEIVFTSEIADKCHTAISAELGRDDFFAEDFAPILDKLEDLKEATKEQINCSVSMGELLDDLNDASHSSLWIVQSHNPDLLRKFSHRLGSEAYERRRQEGSIEPLVSFVFDEADEFIPQDDRGTYKLSREIAETLARRGRKFGLGIGIATQRIIYLDTSIMAQPHTYLISKLPRKSDRDRLAEAFSISEDMFRQTFKFKKGNWLLVSFDATGLEAIPVPIKTFDANERIRRFLNDHYSKPA